jgi:hypothetical protein
VKTRRKRYKDEIRVYKKKTEYEKKPGEGRTDGRL